MNRRRTAYALVEMLVVMTVIALLLTLCAGLLHLLMKLDRSGRAASDEAADMARLGRDFRADAHASRPIDPPGRTAERITLSIEGERTVEYQVRPKDILRTLREGEKVRGFETYRKPPRASVRLEVDPAGSTPFVTLVVDRPAEGRDDSLYHHYRIEAELGKDRRLSPRPE